jgi:hypothetical protein
MLELKECETRQVSGGDGSGWFTCISGYTPYFLGASLCAGSNNHLYASVGVGTPGLNYSAGYSTNLNNYLTGSSVEAAAGGYFLGGNTGSLAAGISEGSPISASYSYGFDMGTISAAAQAVGNFMSGLMSEIGAALGAFAHEFS